MSSAVSLGLVGSRVCPVGGRFAFRDARLVNGRHVVDDDRFTHDSKVINHSNEWKKIHINKRSKEKKLKLFIQSHLFDLLVTAG